MFYTQSKMLETKAIVTAFLWLFGVPLWFATVLLNIGTWKADVIFGLTSLLMLGRIVHSFRTQHQQYIKRKIELEIQKMELKEKKSKLNGVHFEKNKK